MLVRLTLLTVLQSMRSGTSSASDRGEMVASAVGGSVSNRRPQIGWRR